VSENVQIAVMIFLLICLYGALCLNWLRKEKKELEQFFLEKFSPLNLTLLVYIIWGTIVTVKRNLAFLELCKCTWQGSRRNGLVVVRLFFTRAQKKTIVIQKLKHINPMRIRPPCGAFYVETKTLMAKVAMDSNVHCKFVGLGSHDFREWLILMAWCWVSLSRGVCGLIICTPLYKRNL
jgi:hypothetical protein